MSNICANCEYVQRRTDDWTDWGCGALNNQTLNFVTGKTSPKYYFCKVINSEGRCPDYKKNTKENNI